jgi:hypothetical protein
VFKPNSTTVTEIMRSITRVGPEEPGKNAVAATSATSATSVGPEEPGKNAVAATHPNESVPATSVGPEEPGKNIGGATHVDEHVSFQSTSDAISLGSGEVVDYSDDDLEVRRSINPAQHGVFARNFQVPSVSSIDPFLNFESSRSTGRRVSLRRNDSVVNALGGSSFPVNPSLMVPGVLPSGMERLGLERGIVRLSEPIAEIIERLRERNLNQHEVMEFLTFASANMYEKEAIIGNISNQPTSKINFNLCSTALNSTPVVEPVKRPRTVNLRRRDNSLMRREPKKNLQTTLKPIVVNPSPSNNWSQQIKSREQVNSAKTIAKKLTNFTENIMSEAKIIGRVNELMKQKSISCSTALNVSEVLTENSIQSVLGITKEIQVKKASASLAIHHCSLYTAYCTFVAKLSHWFEYEKKIGLEKRIEKYSSPVLEPRTMTLSEFIKMQFFDIAPPLECCLAAVCIKWYKGVLTANLPEIYAYNNNSEALGVLKDRLNAIGLKLTMIAAIFGPQAIEVMFGTGFLENIDNQRLSAARFWQMLLLMSTNTKLVDMVSTLAVKIRAIGLPDSIIRNRRLENTTFGAFEKNLLNVIREIFLEQHSQEIETDLHQITNELQSSNSAELVLGVQVDLCELPPLTFDVDYDDSDSDSNLIVSQNDDSERKPVQQDDDEDELEHEFE